MSERLRLGARPTPRLGSLIGRHLRELLARDEARLSKDGLSRELQQARFVATIR